MRQKFEGPDGPVETRTPHLLNAADVGHHLDQRDLDRRHLHRRHLDRKHLDPQKPGPQTLDHALVGNGSTGDAIAGIARRIAHHVIGLGMDDQRGAAVGR